MSRLLATVLAITVAEELVQNKDIFDRDPLGCSFTLLDARGASKNDLVVIGVHLASGKPSPRRTMVTACSRCP